MKANEAPERIYLDSRKAWQKTFYDYFTIKAKANDIEYIRKDAFIEKACDWFRTLDDKEPPYKTTEEFIEGFKKAMAI